jgi:hypothetical protein
LRAFDKNYRRLNTRCNCCAPTFAAPSSDTSSLWLATALKRERGVNEMTGVAPPAEGWFLVARQRISADKIYSAGCRIEAEKLGRNLAALLRIGAVVWMPGHTPVAASSRELPEPPKPAPKPKVVLLEVRDDPVASWKRTREHMIKKCNGDAQLARDLLDGDERARDLYRLACRVGCEAEARRRRVVSVGPDEIGL